MNLIAHLLIFLCTAALLSAAPRPNIILAMADDMGWGDPSYASNTVTYPDGSPHPDQGWISTPTLDAMAANGLRFDRFYAASAVCSPTRASCLTGRNPFRIGVPTANSGRLGFDETPLSEVLSAAGYRCGHFGKWHLGSMTTLRADSNRGGNAGVYSAPWHHSYHHCFATESKVPTYHPYRKANNSLALPTSFADPNFYGTYYWRLPATWNESSGEGLPVPVTEVNDPTDGDDSKLLVDQALPFLQEAVSNNQPFFLVLWFHTPHKPVVDPDGMSNVDGSDAARKSIEDLDTAIGQVRTELTSLGIRGNTMFWVTSDNGPENGVDAPNESSTVRSIRSGRLLERKRSLHEGGVRVPGILEWPDVITTGATTGFPAVTSDYYPTILDYLGISVPGQKPLDGISLRPVIEGTSTTRSRPIGFKFGSDNSWMNQRYKLIDDGSGWELHDLVNIPAGEEAEETPLATAADLATRSPEIQAVYNSMLAEFQAWDTSVGGDLPYIHSSQPTAALSGPAAPVSLPFTLTATFSEVVNGLTATDFLVENGALSDLSGGGTHWAATVTPQGFGPVNISLPEGSAFDSDGNPSASANPFTVAQTTTLPLTANPVFTALHPEAGQTVDSLDNVPGAGSNNVLKFTAGTVNDGVANPFTTTLYTRSSTGAESAERRIRAFTRFDLSALNDLPVAAATLRFRGHSLNDNGSNDTSIEAVALAADWSVTGAPIPLFDHPTVGDSMNGGSVITNLAAGDHTRIYQIDATTPVRNWSTGAWPNHGLQIRLTNTTINNGVGIKTSGADALELIVEERPLVIMEVKSGPDPEDLTLSWSSAPDLEYAIETSDTLSGPWTHLAIVPASPGLTTTYRFTAIETGSTHRFYRIAYPAP